MNERMFVGCAIKKELFRFTPPRWHQDGPIMAQDGPQIDPCCKMQTLELLGLHSEVVHACMHTVEASMNTTLVERAHASKSMIARRHPDAEHAQMVY